MDQRPKRQVSYNEEAVLCPVCKKRIRLNNDGRVRAHMSGRFGSQACIGSYAEPPTILTNLIEVKNVIGEEPKLVKDSSFQKEIQESMFSDLP